MIQIDILQTVTFHILLFLKVELLIVIFKQTIQSLLNVFQKKSSRETNNAFNKNSQNGVISRTYESSENEND